MSIVPRRARESDLSAITEIYGHHVRTGLASFETEPPDVQEMTRRFREITGRGLPYLVAEVDGVVAGYAYASPYRSRPAYRFSVENSVYIHPSCTGRGLGRSLMSALIAECERQGCRQMVAVIGDSGNAASIGLHDAMGFRHAGVLKSVGLKFGRWADTVIMQREIGEGDSTLPRDTTVSDPVFTIRTATHDEIPALQELIALSVRGLQTAEYSHAQREGALDSVFGVDSRLIADGTYFVVECGNAIAGCGGWSRRKTLYGGDQWSGREDNLLDPQQDAAKIRAFFVHPDWARRGVGSLILETCETAAMAAGFTRCEMGATLTGVPFYETKGYVRRELQSVPLSNGEVLPILRMDKLLTRS